MKMLDRPCYGCPFTPASIVSPDRVRDIAETCVARDVHFICHSSVEGPTAIPRLLKMAPDRGFICRGYYDAIYTQTGAGQLVRIVERFGGLEEVRLTPEEITEKKAIITPYSEQRRGAESKPKKRRKVTP